MRSLLPLLSLGLAAATFAGNVQAADPLTGRPTKEDAEYQHRSHFFLNFGIQNGGDQMWALVETDSTGTTVGEQIDSSRAGGYTRLTFGGEIAFGQSPISLQIGAGLLRDGLTSNVDESKSVFKRKVIELIPFWNVGRHRFGVGATAHLEPVFYANPDGPGSYNQEFDDAVGLLLQYDIRYDQDISVGFRYTNIKYEYDEATVVDFGDGPMPLLGDDEYAGNSFGIHLTYAF